MRALRRQRRARSGRSRRMRGKQDHGARSAATSPLILQRGGDSFQAHNDCLNAAGNDGETRPIQNREPAERSITKEFEPRADVKRNHSPRLGHNSTELALNAKRLAEKAYISSEKRGDCRPVTENWIHQSAVGDADKNDYVRNAVGQIVQDLAAPTRLACRDRDHSIEHVEPEPQITKQRRDNQEPSTLSLFPKTNRGDAC